MKKPIVLTPQTERAIVRDYVCTGRSLNEIAATWGISLHRLNNIRKRHGVHRYRTRKMKSVDAVRTGTEPTPQAWRCRCGGPADSPDGHERCRAA